MNSETPKERKKRLQRERQQRKRQSDKENIAPHPKRVNDRAEAIVRSVLRFKACLSFSGCYLTHRVLINRIEWYS